MNSIIGPINVSQAFIIVTIIPGGSNPYYVLDSVASGSSVTYFLNNDIPTAANIPIFSATGTPGNLRLFDTTNSIAVGLVNNTSILGIDNSTNFNFEQTVAAPWWSPAILLTSVLYDIKAGNQQAAIYTSSDGNAPVSALQLLMLPITWYGNCQGNTYNSITSLGQTLENWYCLVNPTAQQCQSVSTLGQGWTLLPECQQQIRYNYCPPGQNCGASNCNGPCPKEYYDCESNNQQFACYFDSSKYFEDESWWSSPLFIGGVIGITVLIIAIIVFIVLAIRRKSNK